MISAVVPLVSASPPPCAHFPARGVLICCSMQRPSTCPQIDSSSSLTLSFTGGFRFNPARQACGAYACRNYHTSTCREPLVLRGHSKEPPLPAPIWRQSGPAAAPLETFPPIVVAPACPQVRYVPFLPIASEVSQNMQQPTQGTTLRFYMP